MKSAAVFKKNDKLYLQAYSETTTGMETLDGPVFTPNKDNLLEIGKAVINVLNESKKGIPHPDYKQYKERQKNDPLLKAIGVKTYNSLMKSSKKIMIDNTDNKTVKFIPKKFNGVVGDNKGYKSLEDKSVILEVNNLEQLGRSLLEAFERCE